MRYRIVEKKELNGDNTICSKYTIERRYFGFLYIKCVDDDSPIFLFVISSIAGISLFVGLILGFTPVIIISGGILCLFSILTRLSHICNRYETSYLSNAKSYIKEKIKKSEFKKISNKSIVLGEYDIKNGELVYEENLKLEE